MSEQTYQRLSLREAAQHDHNKGLKDKLTGWGRICKERHDKGLRQRTKKSGK